METTREPCDVRAACGGCALMDRSGEEQRAIKAGHIARAMGRPPDEVVPSPRQLGYRARIRLAVDGAGRLCYHRPRSHEQVPIPLCAIARPEVNEALARFRAAVPDARGLQDVELRSDGARVVFAARTARRGRPPALDGVPDVALNGRALSGDPQLSLEVAGIRHRRSPSTFYQVNLEANALLVAAVVEEALALAPEAALDLYAGAGNLSLPLAAAGVPVTLLEREGVALKDARATAAAHGLQVQTRAAPAEKYRAGDHAFDLALLDPPRAGAPGVVQALVRTRPRALIYVSCNPVTLGRDLRPALEAGYAIKRLTGFDFFPQTPHVETLCVLTRA